MYLACMHDFLCGLKKMPTSLNPDRTISKVKRAGEGIMLWGYFPATGAVKLVKVDG